MLTSRTRLPSGAPRIITFAALGSALASVAAILFVSWWAAQTANSVARDSTGRLVGNAIASEVERLTILVEDYAWWDVAFDLLREADAGAVYENLGSGAADSDSFDELYFLDPAGTPLFAFESGTFASDLALFETAGIEPLVSRLSEEPVEPYRVLTTFVRRDGHVALLAAARVRPDMLGSLGAGDLPLMVGGIRLDEADLARLGDILLIEDLRFGSASRTRPEARLPLVSLDGSEAAWLAWTPPRPGREILMRSMPVVAVTAGLLFIGILVAARAATSQTRAVDAARQAAFTDPLTRTLNRAGLEDALSAPDMAQAAATGGAAALYIDLDDLKSINDTLGHEAGDCALRLIADRLRSVTRATDIVARIGGDEFVVLVIDPHPEATARAVGARITALLQDEAEICGRARRVTATIGIAVARPGDDWAHLISSADAAMYDGKPAAARAKAMPEPEGPTV